MKKRLIAAALLLTLMLTLTACGGGGSLEGTWKFISGSQAAIDQKFNFANLTGTEITLIFKDGDLTRITKNASGESEEHFSYKVNGSKLEINGNASEFTIKENTLSLALDGTEQAFTRQ
ncbi:MAG: hypothetical protein J5472_00155 [Clostridia bacterium]|nr:hypothetical protein [Clostridia bacterium]